MKHEVAERAVIGAVLAQQAALVRISPQLSDDDFGVVAHRSIWRAVLSLHAADKPIDLVTVWEEISRLGLSESSGGLAYVSSIANELPDPANIEHYADIVRMGSAARRLERVISVASSHSAAGEFDEAVSTLRSGLSDVDRLVSGRHIKKWDDLIEQALKNIEHEHRSGKVGIPTGFVQVDGLLCGLRRGELIVVAARPGTGKTAFALNVSLNVAKAGMSVLVASAEMGDERLVRRILAIESGIENVVVQSSALNDDSWGVLVGAADRLKDRNLKIWIDGAARQTVATIRSTAHNIANTVGLDLVAVDYLQLVSPDVEREIREQEVASVSAGLKALAIEMDVPVIALAQLNRAVELRAGKKPTLADLRESGRIEQDADVVMFLSTSDDNMDGARTISVEVAKHRNGPLGACKLIYLPKRTMFVDYVMPSKRQEER